MSLLDEAFSPPVIASLTTMPTSPCSVHSNNMSLLVVTQACWVRSCLRTFAFVIPSAWNALPLHIQKVFSLTYYGSLVKNNYFRGFPGGAVVENLPAKAGDTGSSPGLGRSHMPQSNYAREPQLLSLHSATREAAIVRGPRTAMKSGPTCCN